MKSCLSKVQTEKNHLHEKLNDLEKVSGYLIASFQCEWRFKAIHEDDPPANFSLTDFDYTDVKMFSSAFKMKTALGNGNQ